MLRYVGVLKIETNFSMLRTKERRCGYIIMMLISVQILRYKVTAAEVVKLRSNLSLLPSTINWMPRMTHYGYCLSKFAFTGSRWYNIGQSIYRQSVKASVHPVMFLLTVSSISFLSFSRSYCSMF